MMHKKRISGIVFIAVSSLLGLAFLSGCYREKATEAEITVYDDSSGAPVNGATVRLYCNSANCIIDDIQTTGSDGVSRHKFKAGTEYILFIEAKKNGKVNSANDYIQLEQRKVNTASVTLR